MTGTTVTKSPSCKSCSSAFKTEESTPFITIRKSLRITLASELEAALLTNETISFIDAGCFSYFKEEQPIIFLQFPRKFMVIKILSLHGAAVKIHLVPTRLFLHQCLYSAALRNLLLYL